MTTNELAIQWLLLHYRVSRWRERTQFWLAWKLPRWLVYYAVIRCWAHATTGQYGNTHPDDLTWHEALNRWIVRPEPLDRPKK